MDTNKKLNFDYVSETGLVRKENQDSVYLSSKGIVFCVADGMGGGSCGALASSIMCEEVKNIEESLNFDANTSIESAIKKSNVRIFEYASKNGLKQMGTTVVALAFETTNTSKAFAYHIGDSRLYRIRDGRAELLTSDHTFSNQLIASVDGNMELIEQLQSRNHPLSHILTRVVGGSTEVKPDKISIEVLKGDKFLLCSDGVHDVVDIKMLEQIFLKATGVKSACCKLKETVLQKGAADNFSFIVIEVESV